MSEFTVYSVPGSPFGRSVMAALEEKGASWRLSPVAPGTMRSPGHLARHPFGRVPVLEHDGFSLYETQAILRYLDRILPAPALSPSDPKRLARMDQVMNINDWYLFHGVGNVIVFHRVIGPRVMGLPAEGDRSRDAEGAHGFFRAFAASRRASFFQRRLGIARRSPGGAAHGLLHPDAGMGGTRCATSKSHSLAQANGSTAEPAGNHLGARLGAGEGGVRREQTSDRREDDIHPSWSKSSFPCRQELMALVWLRHA